MPTEDGGTNVEARLPSRLAHWDEKVTRWLALHSIAVLRISLGIVFLVFGFLKFFPGVSPAEELSTSTINVLSFRLIPELIPGAMGRVLLATLECTIGLGLLTGKFLRVILLLLGLQLVGAMSPLFIFPGKMFGGPIFAPTLAGQYVIKDIILVAAAMVIGATVRGGRIVADEKHLAEEANRLQAGSDSSP